MNKKFEISGWVVDPNKCLLVRSAENLKLEPKAMALLVVLAKSEGELVSRKELFEAIWPGQHVTDYALNTLIANLRKNFGDSLDGSRLIETRPKLGYRLSQKPVWLDENSQQETITDNDISRGAGKKITVATLTFLLAVILTYTLYLSQFKSEVKVPDQVNQGTQLTRYLVNVTVHYTHSEMDSEGRSLCSDFSYETISKAIYQDQRWRIVGQYFSYDLKQKGPSLLGMNENHRVEYKHQLGKEVDEMRVNVDEGGKLTGQSDMKVFDLKGNLLCKGNGLFIGTVISE